MSGFHLSIAPEPEPDEGGEIVMETTNGQSSMMTDSQESPTTNGTGSGHSNSHNTGSEGFDTLPPFDSKRAKIDYFSKDCTPITDYLFVGGKKVASSEEKLKEKG